jgi:hypothetical protein
MPQIPNVNPYFDEGVDFALNVGSIVAPTSVISGVPTIVDANSLGILVTGAGIGQVKRFLATAAVKNAANPVTPGPGPNPLDNDPNILAEPLISNNEVSPILVPDNLKKPGGSDYKTKFLGTYVFDTLTFGPDQFYDSKFGSDGIYQSPTQPTLLETLRLNSAIISVTIDRTIVQTTPIGSTIGTIKEFISLGEYNIKVTGHIVNDTNPLDYPTAVVQLLNNYVKAPIAIKANSIFLNTIFGINKVVIESCNISQVEGFSGVLTYELSMISDTDIGVETLTTNNTGPLQNPNQV